MKHINKIIFASFALSLCLIVSFNLLSVKKTNANASLFPPAVRTNNSTSTTSPAYLTFGTASSTLTYDAYAGGQTFAADSAGVLVDYVASSSAGILLTSVQYSQNCLDWYQDNVNNIATTSISQNITTPNSYSFKGSATASSSLFAFTIAMPFRCARVVFTTNSGTAGSVYGILQPKRQLVQ